MPQQQDAGREARLFRDNESQALRIPAAYEISRDRVTVRRDGERLIIEPVQKMNSQISRQAFCLPRQLSCKGIADA